MEIVTPHFFVGIFMVAIGFLIKRYPNLIAGYNSLPKVEKEKVDIERLSTRMKVTFIIMGLLLTIVAPILNFVGLDEYVTNTNIGIILIGTSSLFIHRNYSKPEQE